MSVSTTPPAATLVKTWKLTKCPKCGKPADWSMSLYDDYDETIGIEGTTTCGHDTVLDRRIIIDRERSKHDIATKPVSDPKYDMMPHPAITCGMLLFFGLGTMIALALLLAVMA